MALPYAWASLCALDSCNLSYIFYDRWSKQACVWIFFPSSSYMTGLLGMYQFIVEWNTCLRFFFWEKLMILQRFAVHTPTPTCYSPGVNCQRANTLDGQCFQSNTDEAQESMKSECQNWTRLSFMLSQFWSEKAFKFSLETTFWDIKRNHKLWILRVGRPWSWNALMSPCIDLFVHWTERWRLFIPRNPPWSATQVSYGDCLL